MAIARKEIVGASSIQSETRSPDLGAKGSDEIQRAVMALLASGDAADPRKYFIQRVAVG